MAEKHLILCGGSRITRKLRSFDEKSIVRLDLGPGKNKVHLNLHHLTSKIVDHLPDVAVDLLEIATYVYAADRIVSRGGTKEFEYGVKWHRELHFEIPVRQPDLWNEPGMLALLKETIGFLSDDSYQFNFSKLASSKPFQLYLNNRPVVNDKQYEEVILFSGGLDSFGGAVREILEDRRQVVLVSHRPLNAMYARQTRLVDRINERLSNRSRQPLHVAIEVNKTKGFGREPTQRSRSFLFASMAAAVALSMQLKRIRFYENGVVSINLPLSVQAVGGRATRTTHPKVLDGFSKIYSRAFGHEFEVENPYLSKTKAQILRQIQAAGCSEMCADTSSCAHPMEQTKEISHCGYCSQCVDRRLNTLAAGYNDIEDPQAIYKSDVIRGERTKENLTLIERYRAHCFEMAAMTGPEELLIRFPEVVDVLNYLEGSSEQGLNFLFDLHKRHANDICKTIENLVKQSTHQIAARQYPLNSLLGVASGRAELYAGFMPELANTKTLEIDEQTFSVSYQGHQCNLGNSMEFKLLARLYQSKGKYVMYDTLRASVWENEFTEKNAIQRVKSNLVRALSDSGIDVIQIDGSQRNCYKLTLIEEKIDSELSENSVLAQR